MLRRNIRREPGGGGTRGQWKEVQIKVYGTTKRRSDLKRREKEKTEEATYLGPAPEGLFECRLVIPNADQFPNGLENLSGLDTLRQSQRVWIDVVEPDVLSVRSKTMANLREAMGAINWALHDMRLSIENPAAQFIVQMPKYAHAEGLVFVDLGARPVIRETDAPNEAREANVIVNDLGGKIAPGLSGSMETLRGLDKDLSMRAHLGRINIRQKKTGAGREFSLKQFEQLMKTYSIRGGASLNSELADVQFVDNVIDWFSNPAHGLVEEAGELECKCTLAIVSPECELGGTVQDVTGPSPQVWLENPFSFEHHPRLDCTVASPDRQFDWNFEVHAGNIMDTAPNGMRTMIQNLPMSGAKTPDVSRHLIFPTLKKLRPNHIDKSVNETKLKSSVLLPMIGTPYVIKISITKSWKGPEVTAAPTTTWGIEFYGMHWNEIINTASRDGRKKDWGKDMDKIWAGSDPSLDSRLGDFLHCILRIQAALDDLVASRAQQSE
ncbi:unnamed protein product [Clonostachys chloroleuca]|uniref:Uncharacterized protein n=1 Tax=Clonostachys chloroleuca TaxID=1926264 RepID=A0AA35QDI9_9HYPO|nr:unnamed protein product [Clonostachys chloroleuca]